MKRFVVKNKNIVITDVNQLYGALTVEGNNFLDSTRVTGNVSIGFFSYVGRYSELNNVKIGRYCSIAPRVIVGSSEHPIDEFSSHLIAYSDRGPFNYINGIDTLFCGKSYSNNKITTIGNDVWVGDSVFIKRGVTVGDGAVIGSGAIITKDVAPYTIVTSDNNRIVRNRFENHEIIFNLQQSRWWDYDISEISSQLIDCASALSRIDFIIKNIRACKKIAPNKIKILRDRGTGEIVIL